MIFPLTVDDIMIVEFDGNYSFTGSEALVDFLKHYGIENYWFHYSLREFGGLDFCIRNAEYLTSDCDLNARVYLTKVANPTLAVDDKESEMILKLAWEGRYE